MDLQLAGKTAVVTGASRGIGLAVTKALTNEGVRVVGAARTVSPELTESAAVAVSGDLSTREGTGAVVAAAMSELGGVDMLVNNVGAGDAKSLSLAGFLDADDEQWRRLFDTSTCSARSGQPARRCQACSRGAASS